MMPQGRDTSIWCHVDVVPLRIQIIQSQRVDVLQASLIQSAAEYLVSRQHHFIPRMQGQWAISATLCCCCAFADAVRMRL